MRSYAAAKSQRELTLWFVLEDRKMLRAEVAYSASRRTSPTGGAHACGLRPAACDTLLENATGRPSRFPARAAGRRVRRGRSLDAPQGLAGTPRPRGRAPAAAR